MSNAPQTPTTPSDRALTAEEHNARAMLLGVTRGGNLWYDAAINAYRPRSPAGHAYKYSGCLDATTLEPLERGEALRRQEEAKVGNGVCSWRLGVHYERPKTK